MDIQTRLQDLEDEKLYIAVMIQSLDAEDEGNALQLAELNAKAEVVQGEIDEIGRHEYHSASEHVSNSTPNSVASSASAGLKRSAPSSFSSNDTPYKRHTPSPLPAESATSHRTSIATLVDRARRRQQEAEEAIRRQREQTRLDEEYARSLHSDGHNGSQGRLGGLQSFSAAGPSFSRPAYQATLSSNGGIQPPIRPVPIEAPPLPSHTTIKPEVDRPYHRVITDADFVDLTAESDDEAEPSFLGSRPVVYPSFPPPGRRDMPGSCPSTMQHSGAYVVNNHASNANGVYANPGQAMAFASQPGPSAGPPYVLPSATVPSQSFASRAQNIAGHMANGISNVANHLANPYTQLRALIDGSNVNPYAVDDGDPYSSDDSLIFQGHYRTRPPAIGSSSARDGLYAGREDLYKSRYEMLESYNPEKTKEELNALLNNIRPDEDLPDHLLVQTPEPMAVKLHKYQELGLTWLKKCEEGTNKGGILADDMGLGKTIQMLSLIVSRKSTDPRCKTTLIVAPVALLRQWKQEAEQRVKRGRHALNVYIHHGASKKSSARELQKFDIVLTTFGSLAAELKRREAFALRQNHDPSARRSVSEACALLDPDVKWYRVILDEAQCIKNKSTQSAKAACMLNAEHRFCMSGTPMMNNVDELYSLIKFLRIKPYDRWEKFRMDLSQPLKSMSQSENERAMRMLQALCKAVMLRRTKKSTYHGQPILVLPERTNDTMHAEFDNDENQIYQALEQRTQITFNKYLRAGAVGRSYSAILVLLLRLRQACCHPHLIRDFSIAAAADLTETQLTDLAKELAPQVVERIKASGGNFECPICMDACENPAIFIPCGHDTCRDCYVKLADPSAALQNGSEGAPKARCPHCRQNIDPKRITDFTSFKRVHMPELLTEEEKAQFGVADDDATESEEDDDSETESEDDEDDGDETLGGFIVDDDHVNGETESEAEEAKPNEELMEGEASASKRTLRKSTSKGKAKKKSKSKKIKRTKDKGKAPAKDTTKLSLAELKAQSNRSARAKKQYLRRLREDYHDSAKIRKLVELLDGIMNNPEQEKVLVFSQWTSLLDLCEVEISGKGWNYRRYDGSMNAGMRADAVDDFKDPSQDVRIMMVSLKAGNAGLNLNVASQVIILDPFWNPYIEEQAIDRAHRIGQTRPVRVHRILVENTVEDRIVALQEKKRKLIEQALDEQQASQLSRLGVRELAYLFGVSNTSSD